MDIIPNQVKSNCHARQIPLPPLAPRLVHGRTAPRLRHLPPAATAGLQRWTRPRRGDTGLVRQPAGIRPARAHRVLGRRARHARARASLRLAALVDGNPPRPRPRLVGTGRRAPRAHLRFHRHRPRPAPF